MRLSWKRGETKRHAPAGDAYSVLHASLTVTGDIETDGTVRIDGRLVGSVRRAGLVVLGPDASVQGDVCAREVIVGGAVHGNVAGTDRVELQPTAVVTGDIETAAILIHEGGAVRGRLSVRPHEARAVAPAPAARPIRIPTAAAGEAS